MDELACPASSGVPPFPVSLSSAVSHDQHPPALEFMSGDEILEQWLLGKQDEEEPRDGRRRAIQPTPPAPFVERSRPGAWKKPGPRTCAPAMSHVDKLVCPAFSCGPTFPPPSSSAVGHNEALEALSSCDVPEQRLLGDGTAGKHDDGEDPQDAGVNLPPAPPPTERGRKPGPRTTAGLAISHVEAERQRRDRLNRRFCDLRAAVPKVSRMDRSSILSDAVAYIAELRGRVEKLEEAAAEAKRTAAAASQSHYPLLGISDQENMALEVRMVGREAAALRLTMTTTAASHSPARLMAALRALDLPVHHACVCRVGGVTVQDVVVDVPSAGLRREGRLRAALQELLLQESG